MTTDFMLDQEDEDAALWVARHMNNAVDATGFAQWLAGGEGRRERFDALWATCMDDAVVDGARLFETQEKARTGNARKLPRRLAMVAAAAACVGLMAYAWPALQFALTPAQTYVTSAGEVRHVTLADGSAVTLNSASRIRVWIGEGRRKVALEAGEALFDVRHDENRPFVVTAGAAQVTVLGTCFDVALNADRVDLMVKRGLVRFASEEGKAAPVLVRATQSSSLADGKIAAPVPSDDKSSLDWRDGWLQVSDMPLEQLAPRLQRWMNRTIVVADPALLRKRVAGRFRLTEPVVVLENLGALYGFKVRKAEGSYILETG